MLLRIVILISVIIISLIFKYYFLKCQKFKSNILEGFNVDSNAVDTTTISDEIADVEAKKIYLDHKNAELSNEISNKKPSLQQNDVILTSLANDLTNANSKYEERSKLYNFLLQDNSVEKQSQIDTLKTAINDQAILQMSINELINADIAADANENNFNSVLTNNNVNLWLTTQMYNNENHQYVSNQNAFSYSGFLRRNLDSWNGINNIGKADRFLSGIVFDSIEYDSKKRAITCPRKSYFKLPNYYYDSPKETFFAVISVDDDIAKSPFGVILLSCWDESEMGDMEGRTVSIGSSVIAISLRNNGRGIIGQSDQNFPIGVRFLLSFSIDYSQVVANIQLNGKPLTITNNFNDRYTKFNQKNKNKSSCVLSYRPGDQTYNTNIPVSIYEMIGFNNTKMNDTDIVTINKYLIKKWEITDTPSTSPIVNNANFGLIAVLEETIYLPLRNDLNYTGNSNGTAAKFGNVSFINQDNRDAIVFNGKLTDYITIPFLNPTLFTFSFWIYVKAYPREGNTAVSICSHNYFENINNPSIQCDFESSSTSFHAALPTRWTSIYQGGIPLNTWTHLTYICDQSAYTTKLYINGQKVSSGNGTGGLGNNKNEFVIGRSGDNGRGFNGYLSEFRYYDKLLSDKEVAGVIN